MPGGYRIEPAPLLGADGEPDWLVVSRSFRFFLERFFFSFFGSSFAFSVFGSIPGG
jgi:hypothetical protein